jgi:hypothetical protein
VRFLHRRNPASRNQTGAHSDESFYKSCRFSRIDDRVRVAGAIPGINAGVDDHAPFSKRRGKRWALRLDGRPRAF